MTPGRVVTGFAVSTVISLAGWKTRSLTHRGALLILGDGRNNYHDPHADALAELVDRARHAYWLNPEAKQHWGTGDSAATDYADVIDMFECRNATQLGSVIADLLPI
jgi:uncharacterized protein with von Willebrand factor type A (vWA) domain